MNRKIVINMEALKGTSYYNNFIEKARKGEQIGGKYLYREEIAEQVKTVKGKTVVRRYNYYYLTDLLKDSAEKILENIGKFFFKGKEKVETKKLDEAYKTQNIEKDYGADKKTWYQHCMEYLSHKAKWDKRFSNKDNAEKFKTPIKQKVAEKVDVPGMGTTAEETPEIKTTIETKKKEETWKPNPSLMRKVWSLYNDVKPSKTEIDVGDTIELNGRKGTVTKKVNDNMVMISFEDGGLGRFFKKDLNKVEVSNESVANEADLNGKIQEITTGLNTSNDTVEESMDEHGNHIAMLGNDNAKKDFVDVKPDFSEMDKKLLALALYKEKEFNPTMNDYYYYEKLRDKYPNLASKGSIYSIMEELKGIDVKNINLDEVKEYVEKIKGGGGGDEPPKNDAKKSLDDIAEVIKNGGRVVYKNPSLGNVVFESGKLGDLTPKNKNGYGIKHLIASRYLKEGMNIDEISALFIKIKEIIENVSPNDNEKDKIRLNLKKDGIWVGISKQWNGTDETWIITGFPENQEDGKLIKEATDTIKTVIAQNSYALENSSIRQQVGAVIASINNIITNKENVNTKNDNVRNDGLTQDEADSLEYYVQDAGYTYINDKLRGFDKTPMEENHIEAIKNIDNVISRNIVKEKTLYRGIGGNVLFPTMNPYENRLMNLYFSNKSAYDSLPNDEWYDGVLYKGAKDNVERYIKEIEGRTFNDKGYVSTSKTIDGTKVFTDSYQNPIVIEFQNIPENTHGIDLSNFAEGREFKTENEVLLHRDLNYKITGSKLIDNKVVFTAEIIPESELEKHQNRSNAMLGNQNAAKPFSEEKTKKEQKKVKETREKAGLPKIGINYGERVSAMEDSVSLNPNAENYAYKDTGYIAGSQKEKIQDFWKRKKESGEGTSIEEIDWNTLEENPRYAEQQITKSNILGDIDYNSFREKGMDSRVAYLASRVFAAIPKDPIGHDVTARKNYVIAVNTVKERLSECKTLQDVKEFVDDVYGEYKQTFDSQILRVPEVNKLTQERDGIIKEKNKIRESVMEWCRKELVPKYKALGKKERKAFWRYREELKKEISEKIREYDPNYNNSNINIEIDTSNMWWPINISSEGILQEKIDKANSKLRVARENAKNIIMNNNVTYEVWKELGDFADLRYSKTFQKHYNNLTVYDEKQATKPNGEIYEPYAYKYRDKEYDKYENWDWVDKKTNKIALFKGKNEVFSA